MVSSLILSLLLWKMPPAVPQLMHFVLCVFLHRSGGGASWRATYTWALEQTLHPPASITNKGRTDGSCSLPLPGIAGRYSKTESSKVSRSRIAYDVYKASPMRCCRFGRFCSLLSVFGTNIPFSHSSSLFLFFFFSLLLLLSLSGFLALSFSGGGWEGAGTGSDVLLVKSLRKRRMDH